MYRACIEPAHGRQHNRSVDVLHSAVASVRDGVHNSDDCALRRFVIWVAPDQFFADLSYRFEDAIAQYMPADVDLVSPCQFLGSDDGPRVPKGAF